jgi:hypothetical protein
VSRQSSELNINRKYHFYPKFSFLLIYRRVAINFQIVFAAFSIIPSYESMGKNWLRKTPSDSHLTPVVPIFDTASRFMVA